MSSEALARELHAITRPDIRAVEVLIKMFDGVDIPALGELFDLDALRSHMNAECVRITAEVYTDDELAAAIAFQSSELGRSIESKRASAQALMEASMTAFMASATEGKL